MSVVGTKVRIYDLARELKQDTKRIIEDLRREGADVDVASNSVPKELADKIRNKYFPKADPTPKRAIKVIKKKAEPESAPVVEKIPAASEEAAVSKPDFPPVKEQEISVQKPVEQPKTEIPKIKVLTPKVLKPKVEPKPVEEEKISAVTTLPKEVVEETKAVEIVEIKEIQTAVEEVTSEKPEPKEVSAEVPVQPVTKAEPAPLAGSSVGTQVKQLKLKKTALEKGIKISDLPITVTPTKTGRLSPESRQEKEDFKKDKNKRDRRKNELRGTPGETSTPMEVYTPPQDARRKPGRTSGKKGDKKTDTKDDRFQEREFVAPRPKSIEERILEQVGKVDRENLKPIRLSEGATVREFSEALGVTPRDIVQLLVKRGIFATLNQPIGEKTGKEIGASLGYEVSFVPFEEMVIEQEFEELIASDADDVELPRAPVVTVMGHVDHGKTSLLDAIRHANVAEGEAGGITQHIGAYSVFVPNPDNPDEKRRVVFLDTPGHEAFTMMRARGAKATDIVVLVVAADDGVMPQTIEAIEHSKAAGVPIIVAINKIDKPDANPDKVKQGLANQGLQPVEWGGDIEMVPVSAKKRENLDVLLETVLLQADIMDLRASPTRRASGVVLEAKLDKGRGSVATVLVQQGTLRIGDPFIVGQCYGKVRAMFSDRGENVTEAPPATPVEVLGLQGVPQAGDTFQVVSDIEKAQTIAAQRQMHARQAAMVKTTKRGIESLGHADVKELLVILKADVQGSVEVLRATLEKLSTEKVKVRVIRAGVGAIAESDVLLASATQTDNSQTAVVIIGFNVRPESRAAEVAKQENVEIRLHSVIYKVEEEIRAAMIGMLDAIEKEVILGKALVQETFKVSKVGTIAGCRVTDGVIRRQAKARLIRDGVVIWEGDISSLKRFKDDVSEVKQGFECGMSLVNFNDIKVGDEIEAFVIEKVAATEL
jgi:translation initiation factor IF-2